VDARIEWVICGIRQSGGGAAVLASGTVREGWLARLAQGLRRGFRGARIPVVRNILAAELDGFVVIQGGDYREALASALETWQPPEAGAVLDSSEEER
jgi:hypothetical protein